jgi:hypothetical protein
MRYRVDLAYEGYTRVPSLVSVAAKAQSSGPYFYSLQKRMPGHEPDA